MADIPAWHAKGEWFDICRCNVPCPCSWTQPPDGTIFVRGRIMPEHKNPVNRLLIAVYRPVIQLALRFKALTIVTALVVLALSLWQFEHMERAIAKLKIVIPVTLLIIFVLLFLNFRRITETLIVM